jgi:hypothetical protein
MPRATVLVRHLRAGASVNAKLMWRALIAVAVVQGCDRRPTVTSCDDDLHGVWVADGSARWSLIDYGKTLEAFPLFDDAVPAGAPRVIDVERPAKLAGEVKRRYTQGGDECVGKAPFRIAKCTANSLQVIVADPQPPLGFSPCAWGKPAESRVETWRRD